MSTAPKASAVKPGDLVLDRYRVVEQIASGGHSVVYRGTDERLSRPVCIKLFSGLGGKSGVGRTSYEHFVQEAFALSRLTHPNTLRIYDFGHLGAKDEEGMPLQVCEYMNGGTLSQIVREQGKRAIDETSQVIGAMCAALAEAHGLGIVHRDIKPQNILFGTVGGNRLPKLADFGIAKWSADADEPAKRAEDTAIVAGQKLAMYSPSWAAPEQLAGQPVSAATDIYSLAAVAVYMLTGKAIFADEDVYAGYKKRRHAEELVRDALAPTGVSAQVAALLTTALAFDPKKRLARVEDLQTQLHTGASAPPPAPPQQQHPPPQPQPPQQQPSPYPLAPASAHASGPHAAPHADPPSQPHHPYPQQAPQPQQPPQHAMPYPTAPGHGPPQVQGHAGPVVQPSWLPPTVRPPWMHTAASAGGQVRRLGLADVPQLVGDRNVHFVHAQQNTVDLAGSQAQRVRITFINAQGGVRVLHIKGLTCFVAHLGGRPSPAVELYQPADVSLVTPRAQEIGHIRVANGASGEAAAALVFGVGAERVAIAADDCSDPILFDFGPGSEAYFVYTRGRAIPKSRRR